MNRHLSFALPASMVIAVALTACGPGAGERELTAKVDTLPTSDQIPFDVNTNLIVEFYR